MRLSATERKAQILKTAAKLFAEQGYEGTKTSQIAREAGVNEAIIFRHFTNKEELYWAVLLDMCGSRKAGERMRAIIERGGAPEEVLTTLASDILSRNFADPQWSRLLLYAALENHKLSHRFFRAYVAGYYEEIAGYIRAQARAGIFRADVDPIVAARGFIGMVIYHFWIQELFGGKSVQNFEIPMISRSFARLWANALFAGATVELPEAPEMLSRSEFGNSERQSSSKAATRSA